MNFDFLTTNTELFNGLFHTNCLIHVFHIFIILLSCIVVGLNGFYPRKIWITNQSSLYNVTSTTFVNPYRTMIINKMSQQFKIIEYSLILLFTICGILLLTSSSDLISMFLCLELQSYGLYLISTIYRDSELSTSAGLTYFLLGGLSSCFILMGSAFIYINSGTSNLNNFYIISNVPEMLSYDISLYETYYIFVGFIIIMVGLLFKVSAAPFHFWSPKVYDFIPTIVTTFVATIPKISIFILLLQLIYFSENTFLNFDWTGILFISSLFSLNMGTVLAIGEDRIKRLYAYSTISHVGFMLLALGIHSTESIQAFIYYLIQYSISSLNAFIILLTMSYVLYTYIDTTSKKATLIDSGNSPLQFISQLKGFFHINPFLSLSLTITLFSFIGIPPLMGFFAKQLVLSSAIDGGYNYMYLTAIITSAVSAVYYLFIINYMFFKKSDYEYIPLLDNRIVTGKLYNNNSKKILEIEHSSITVSGYFSIIISILTLILIVPLSINSSLLNMANMLTLTIHCN